jgi:phage shock protein E
VEAAPVDELDEAKAAGARIVDVRTPAEFEQGHVPGSLNLPLDQLMARMGELDPEETLLLCCASGGRSAMAKLVLDREGYRRTLNAGPWTRLL